MKKRVQTLIPAAALIWVLVSGCSDHQHSPGYPGGGLPGSVPEVFAPGIISHGYHEHSITFSPAGDELFYVNGSGDHQRYYILHMKKTGNTWQGPEIAPFSGTWDDMGPRFFAEGTKVAFSSRRPRTEGGEVPGDFDIWISQKKNGEWQPACPIGAPVNTEWNELFPNITADGTLYFQYYRESGSASDFYVSEPVEGQYSAPVKLEYGISTDHYESGIFVSDDGSLLLFQSTRPGGVRGVDLWYSRRLPESRWSAPCNLDSTINALGSLINPSLSPDEKYLFFCANGPFVPFGYRGHSYSDLLDALRGPENGYGTIYWVEADRCLFPCQ